MIVNGWKQSCPILNGSYQMFALKELRKTTTVRITDLTMQGPQTYKSNVSYHSKLQSFTPQQPT
jgi:hypothetical protein